MKYVYQQKRRNGVNSAQTEHNYAQPQFWGWEFSIESQTEGHKKPITNTH